MSLEDLTCEQLVEVCKKEGIAQDYSLKEQLVRRLQNHYEESFTATPDKEFFSYIRKQWKKVKKKTSNKSKEEHFGECMTTCHNKEFGGSLINMSDAQIKAHAHMGQICKTQNPAQTLMQYYRRGKTAWIDEKDSSSDEDHTETGSESNYSDDQSEDQSEDEDRDGTDDSDDKEEEQEEEEEEEETVVVDLNVSPATTWENARKIKKETWIKDKTWVAYMEKLLGDMPRKDWTMKKFLQKLCVHKQIFGYNKNLVAKKLAQLLDSGRIQKSATTASAINNKKKVPPPNTHTRTHTHTHTHTQRTHTLRCDGRPRWTARDFSP